jgi:hypothetical protein
MPTMTRGRAGLGARHPKTGALLHPLGYRRDGRPIWPILGAAPDDDIDVDDEGDKDEDEDEHEGEHDDDEHDDDEHDDDEHDDDEHGNDKLGDAGKKAIQREREKVKALRKENRDLKAKAAGAPDEADTKAEAKWKPVFVRREATHALREAGLIGKPDRLLRLLDIDALDVDIDEESGDVDIDGLDDQITDLRKEYPSLFRKRGSSSIDAADRDEIGGRRKEKRSATQLQADLLLGRA